MIGSLAYSNRHAAAVCTRDGVTFGEVRVDFELTCKLCTPISFYGGAPSCAHEPQEFQSWQIGTAVPGHIPSKGPRISPDPMTLAAASWYNSSLYGKWLQLAGSSWVDFTPLGDIVDPAYQYRPGAFLPQKRTSQSTYKRHCDSKK